MCRALEGFPCAAASWAICSSSASPSRRLEARLRSTRMTYPSEVTFSLAVWCQRGNSRSVLKCSKVDGEPASVDRQPCLNVTGGVSLDQATIAGTLNIGNAYLFSYGPAAALSAMGLTCRKADLGAVLFPRRHSPIGRENQRRVDFPGRMQSVCRRLAVVPGRRSGGDSATDNGHVIDRND